MVSLGLTVLASTASPIIAIRYNNRFARVSFLCFILSSADSIAVVPSGAGGGHGARLSESHFQT